MSLPLLQENDFLPLITRRHPLPPRFGAHSSTPGSSPGVYGFASRERLAASPVSSDTATVALHNLEELVGSQKLPSVDIPSRGEISRVLGHEKPSSVRFRHRQDVSKFPSGGGRSIFRVQDRQIFEIT